MKKSVKCIDRAVTVKDYIDDGFKAIHFGCLSDKLNSFKIMNNLK